MDEKTIIAHVNLKVGEKLTVTKDAQVKLPNYYRIGNGTMNKHKIQSIDLINELITMSTPARRVIGWIKDGMVYDHSTGKIIFIVKLTLTTAYEKELLKKGLPELFAQDLVRRVKRGYYMINPNAIITDYEDQLSIWNTLVGAANASITTSAID